MSLDQKRYEEAMSAADRYLAQSPEGRGTAEAAYLRGRAMEQRPKRTPAEAQAELRKAQEIYSYALSQGPSPTLEAFIRTSLANTCYWLEDYANAEAQWAAAWDQLEGDYLKSWVLYRIGLSQQRQGKWAEADASFSAVQRSYPGSEAAQRARTHQGHRQFFVQVAAFQVPASADKLVNKLRGERFPAVRLPKPDSGLQLVMVGPLKSYPEASAMRSRLQAQYKDALVIP